MKKEIHIVCVVLLCAVFMSSGSQNTTRTVVMSKDTNSIKAADLVPEKKTNPNTRNRIFAQKLADGKFGEFFRYPMHDETIKNIWKDSVNHQLLEDIIEDDSVSDKAKFLACVVLDQMEMSYGARHSQEKIVLIYAKALVNNYTGMANSWGLLYEQMDDGPQGIKFIAMRKFAAPVLIKLLDDERTHLTYHGSIEATIGNRYKYRIKDFAAYYLGRMMGKPLKYYKSYAERDKQIEKLKEDIKMFKF